MPTIRLNVDALEIKSFATTTQDATAENALAATTFCSAVSETNGVFQCKTCGPCCA